MFLEEINFKKVVEIKDETILKKIHFNFRLNYLVDCIIASYIDEIILSTCFSKVFI